MNTIKQVFWKDVRTDIKKINPDFYHLLEAIKPSNSLPFFKASYDFGEHFGIRNDAYLPNLSGRLCKIESLSTDSELYQHLGYGKDSLPLGMILDKYCEWHHIGDDGYLYPDITQGPGTIFNMHIIFDAQNTVKNNFISCSAGALSTFLLPNIGCKRRHKRIQKHFNIVTLPPKNYYEHHGLFKRLIQSEGIEEDWSASILYFSKTFIDEVRNNDKWIKLKLFFSESLRQKQSRHLYDPASEDLFLSTQGIKRFKPPPFIIDTCKYLFNICMGHGLGSIPATDEDYLPLKTIQSIYHEYYDLPYTPTVMVPAQLNQKTKSVYYSQLHPVAKVNAIKTNISNSTLSELEMLQNVPLTYRSAFLDSKNECYASQLYEACRKTDFSFYHYKAAPHTNILPSDLIQEDTRFDFSYFERSKFPYDAKLFRGCVQLSCH